MNYLKMSGSSDAIQVLEMERKVLNELNFELTTPTTKSFLR
jgi:hypothetical protein